MGCGGSDEKKEAAVVETKSQSLLDVEAAVKADKKGEWVFDLYENWDVSGDAVEIKTADGKTRMSWPKAWSEVEASLKELKVADKLIKAMEEELVCNEELAHISAECVTWPSIQNLIRKAWVGVNGEWSPATAAETGNYTGCLRVNTLMAKKDGLSKMLKEMGAEKFLAEMWEVYCAWPCPLGEEKPVQRYNRKVLMRTGEKVDDEKMTWPLAWGAVEEMFKSEAVGWSEEQIAALKTQLLDCKEESGVHPNCSEEEVCWPDVQQAFRSVVEEDAWDEENSKEWDVLAPKITMRLKCPADQVADLLSGEWRMYCKPDEGEPFSYGLIIKDVDFDCKTFGGAARTEGKYVVENGTIIYDEKKQACFIEYDEVWPNGQRDHLKARVKSNKKFQCESAGGFEQKATSESANLPEDPAERAGDGAKTKVKKYYLHDSDAVAD